MVRGKRNRSLTSPQCGPPCQKHLFFSIFLIQVFYDDSWPSWPHHFIFSTEINVKILSNHTDITWSLYHMLSQEALLLSEKSGDSDVGEHFWMSEFRSWWHLLNVGARRLCKN